MATRPANKRTPGSQRTAPMWKRRSWSGTGKLGNRKREAGSGNPVDCETGPASEIAPMSFAQVLDNLPLQKSPLLRRFASLVSAKSDAELEALAQHAHALTLKNFGHTMRLFAPLYLSNE